MSNIKISSNLFLGSPELKRLQKFLSNDGYKRGLLNNSVTFGLIKNGEDIGFDNAKVSSDSDININGTTFKTVKIKPISGFDKNGNFIVSDQINQLPIPGSLSNNASNRWYWIRVSHQYSHEEKGLWSLSSDGSLSGSGGELKEIVRGQPNFPTRIRFTKDTTKYGALSNTQEYDILDVIDDNNAVLNGVNFEEESNLRIEVVGTFTYGAPIENDNKLIFNYDSALVEIIEEPIGSENNRPSTGYETGRTFYIARVRVDGNNLIVQDKRLDYWETKASYDFQDIELEENPLVGVESIKFDHPYTTRDFNIIEVAWGFRSTSWSVNAESNVVTLSSGKGGFYKSVNDFSDGDFNGWRLYAQNGTYSRVISSTRQGNAIDLKVDVLDINSFSQDGGQTFFSDYYVFVTPNAEAIELTFTPNPDDDVPTQEVKYEFDINKLTGVCKVLAYQDPFSHYRLSYRYRNNLTYSESFVATEGKFLDESSFDDDGNERSQTNEKEYSGSEDEYLIEVGISPLAYKNFNFNVEKGDLNGVEIRSSMPSSPLKLTVGEDYYYQYFTGDLSITSDLVIELDIVNNQNGNEFKIHFDASNVNLNGNSIDISYGSVVLKKLGVGDFYQMKNQNGGIIITAKSDGSRWVLSQNYDLGTPGEVKQLAQINNQPPDLLFDSDGWGNVKGLYGYHLADGRNGSVDLRGKFIVGMDPNNSDYVFNQTGGEEKVKLQTSEQGGFQVAAYSDRSSGSERYNTLHGLRFKPRGSGSWVTLPDGEGGSGHQEVGPINVPLGEATDEHENRPPYHTLVFAQKMF